MQRRAIAVLQDPLEQVQGISMSAWAISTHPRHRLGKGGIRLGPLSIFVQNAAQNAALARHPANLTWAKVSGERVSLSVIAHPIRPQSKRAAPSGLP